MRADLAGQEVAAAAAQGPGGRLRAAFRLIRPQQWLKNVLVFVAPGLAHRLEPAIFGRAALAFLSFCLVASSGYVLNDLLDFERDRRHPVKRGRPLAAGALPLGAAVAMVPALLVAGAGVAMLLPAWFVALLAGYYATTLVYSFWMKRKVVLDVLVLASLYTVRLYGGSLATGIPVSEWLALLAMFLFLSLALLKRGSELVVLGSDVPGRGYLAMDRDQVFALGTASGYIAVLVLALYVSSADVARLYSSPRRLWLLCPLALYWVSRLWVDGRRGVIQEDPIVHALRRRDTYYVAGAVVAVLFLAT